MDFDVKRVRDLYPALSDGYAYLDGAAGTQVPQTVIDAIAAAYRSGLGNAGGAFPASDRAGETVARARQAVADLVGGEPEGVVLGPNMTSLTYRLANALAKTWKPGDEIVVSRLDHDANVRPWMQAAERSGVTVRWAEFELPSGELPAEQYDRLIGERTRLVAMTAASNVLGTIPDVERIAAKAHEAGALTYVDGVHATPHGPVDVRRLGADFYATSAYKWSGPHIGAVIAAPDLLRELRPDKLIPAPDDVPWRFETGTPPYADFAGVAAAVDHLASLGLPGAPSTPGSRREQITASMTAIAEYELAEFGHLLTGLREMPHVSLIGAPRSRTATVWFRVAGHGPADVARHLAERRINVWHGHNYAWEAARAFGILEEGGAVRAGLVHYNDRSDVERLLAAVEELK